MAWRQRQRAFHLLEGTRAWVPAWALQRASGPPAVPGDRLLPADRFPTPSPTRPVPRGKPEDAGFASRFTYSLSCSRLMSQCFPCLPPGRQGLPPGGCPGGPPEAPRLHGQALFPEDTAHPAASQVMARTQRPHQPGLSSPTLGISPAKRTGIFFKTLLHWEI